MRRRLAWGVAVPLALAGTEAAHTLAYALVYPNARVRGIELAATGHSYLGWLPIALGIAAACAALTLAATAFDVARGRRARSAPPWVFALLAPSAFALQEILELSLHTGTFGWRALAAPTFVPGLLLQLPFALVAYVAARLLLRAARAVGELFVRATRPRLVRTFVSLLQVPFAGRRTAPQLARGPPCVVGI
jgi:hypothetical protein